MIANETGELQRFGLALQGPMKWAESFRMYGKRGETYDIYGDDARLSRYQDNYYFAECLICGDTTKICPDFSKAKDEHFLHCARTHDYVYPEGVRLKTYDSKLQSLIRLAQEYDLPMPHLDDHSQCLKQYIKRSDGTQIIGCGVHKGNETKIWMGQY